MENDPFLSWQWPSLPSEEVYQPNSPRGLRISWVEAGRNAWHGAEQGHSYYQWGQVTQG